jgi:PKD repeat protein
MYTNKIQIIQKAGLFLAIFAIIGISSCKKEEPAPDPVASFQYAVSETNYLEVTFTNYSTNSETYMWDFGDSQTSTEMNPVHIYASAGSYTVKLTSTNVDGVSANFQANFELTDPLEAQTLLDGGSSKTWKLWRGDGTALGVGPDAAAARSWWSLGNDGLRPCPFYHEFTFNRDGSFVFEDNGIFWGEAALFAETERNEVCFEAVASNMVNTDGADISAFLGGTHQFSYDPVAGEITLTGTGAWMGMPQLGTSAERKVPEASTTFSATLEEMDGYDLLHVSFDYPGVIYWDYTYASYDDPSTEPDVTAESTYGEDLDDVTPTQMFNTFESTAAAHVQNLAPTQSGNIITAGVADPADAEAAKVGEYVRITTDAYTDLKFQMDYDIQFDNFTSFSIDVYIPSSNTYAEGGLTKTIQLWIADQSQTQNFWESWVEYLVDPETIVTDEWKTYTFQLEAPTGGHGTPKTRTDLDLIGLVIGGSGHNVGGTFYIRNFKFE